MSAMIFVRLLSSIVLVVATANAVAKEVDAQQFLNDRLSAKPGLYYSRPLPERKVCTTVVKRDKCSKGAEGGCADNTYEVTQCKVERPAQLEKYTDSGKVGKTRIASVRDLIFDKANTVSLPEKAILSSVDFQNCADVSVTQAISLNVAGTKSYSVAKTDSISTTQGGSVTLSGSFFGNSASATYNFSQTVGLSNTTSEGDSVTVSRATASTISIGPGRSGRFELLIYETTVEIPFSAKVVVDGDLLPNDSGVVLASQLLSEEERTIRFSGSIRLTDVSNAIVRTVPAAKSEQCTSGNPALVVQTNPQITIPASSIPQLEKKKFSPISTFFKGAASKKFVAIPVESLNFGPVIGPADGIGYEVLAVNDVTKPAPFCGFNDLGIMNIGVFSVETRRYTQYSNGNMIASWMDQVETFKRCWP